MFLMTFIIKTMIQMENGKKQNGATRKVLNLFQERDRQENKVVISSMQEFAIILVKSFQTIISSEAIMSDWVRKSDNA